MTCRDHFESHPRKETGRKDGAARSVLSIGMAGTRFKFYWRQTRPLHRPDTIAKRMGFGRAIAAKAPIRPGLLHYDSTRTGQAATL